MEGFQGGETRSIVEMLYIETELWKPAKSFGTWHSVEAAMANVAHLQ